MMEPRIQYAKTSDGVNIGYCVAGSGAPLVVTSRVHSHVQLDWEAQSELRGAAQAFRLVWYDSRGHGLSERRADDFTIDSMLLDLEAVIDAAALERFALVAAADAGPIAVAYAGRNPTRVTHLVLVNSWVVPTDYQQSIAYQIEEALRTRNPEAWLQAISAFVYPDSSEAARRWIAEVPQRINPNALIAAQKAMEGWNAEPFLPLISAPTLVIASPSFGWAGPGVAQRIAATIPNCRLVFEDPRSSRIGPLIGGFILGVPAESFAGPEQRRPDLSERVAPSGTAIILFADIADSTAITEQLGDAAFRAKARELGPTLRALVRECGGTPVEGPTLGDGVLAVFTSARQAIEAALACAQAGAEASLPLHLGLHAGDVSREKDPDGRDNVYGGAVNIASRISGLSAPGEVLVSETVRSLARTSAGVRFEDRGEQALKGVGEPVRVWAVVAGEGAAQ